MGLTIFIGMGDNHLPDSAYRIPNSNLLRPQRLGCKIGF